MARAKPILFELVRMRRDCQVPIEVPRVTVQPLLALRPARLPGSGHLAPSLPLDERQPPPFHEADEQPLQEDRRDEGDAESQPPALPSLLVIQANVPAVLAPDVPAAAVQAIRDTRAPAARTTRAAPIAAVARSVRQAALLSRLEATVVSLCEGEQSQRLGPWDLKFPLESFGLSGSSLDLHLSQGELSLRFRCATSATLDLLSGSVAQLRQQLEDGLKPSLQVAIELTLCTPTT